MKSDERSTVTRAQSDLQNAGYPVVEREKRAQGRTSSTVGDLIAWGAGLDGEFRPQVSVEVKSGNASGHGSLSLALAHLSANAAAFGTATNLVYNDGEWLQADPGFVSLSPVDGPPECQFSEGVVRDPDLLRQLLEARVWRNADSRRGSSFGPFREALVDVLSDLSRDGQGLVQGISPGVSAPADLVVQTWLRAAQATRDVHIGESITPLEVCEVMATIAEVRPKEIVFDPFAGFGGLLASVQLTSNGDAGQLLGYDINRTAHEVASKLLSLLDCKDDLSCVDSRTQQWPKSNVIISAPPFGLRLEEATELPFGRAREVDVAAIAWAAQALKPGGRAVLLTSRGWTFRSSSSAALRSWLANNYRVTALVGLPAVSPITQIPLMLVVIDNTPPTTTVVADLSDDWFEQLAAGTELSQSLGRNS
jgi:hypothetical protein